MLGEYPEEIRRRCVDELYGFSADPMGQAMMDIQGLLTYYETYVGLLTRHRDFLKKKLDACLPGELI